MYDFELIHFILSILLLKSSPSPEQFAGGTPNNASEQETDTIKIEYIPSNGFAMTNQTWWAIKNGAKNVVRNSSINDVHDDRSTVNLIRTGQADFSMSYMTATADRFGVVRILPPIYYRYLSIVSGYTGRHLIIANLSKLFPPVLCASILVVAIGAGCAKTARSGLLSGKTSSCFLKSPEEEELTSINWFFLQFCIGILLCVHSGYVTDIFNRPTRTWTDFERPGDVFRLLRAPSEGGKYTGLGGSKMAFELLKNRSEALAPNGTPLRIKLLPKFSVIAEQVLSEPNKFVGFDGGSFAHIMTTKYPQLQAFTDRSVFLGYETVFVSPYFEKRMRKLQEGELVVIRHFIKRLIHLIRYQNRMRNLRKLKKPTKGKWGSDRGVTAGNPSPISLIQINGAFEFHAIALLLSAAAFFAEKSAFSIYQKFNHYLSGYFT